MSFGWSAGDIVAAVDTLITIGKALRESGGSASEFQDAVAFITGVGKTITGIQTIIQSNPNLDWEPDLVEQATRLKKAVEDFRKKIDKYEPSLGSRSTRRKIQKIPRAIQFALISDIKDLRTKVAQPQQVLNVFINLQAL
jgi:hypothetical protein